MSTSQREFIERKVWIRTFGCQMNYHDSERILTLLEDMNYQRTEEKNEADLILFNSCAVRNLANQKFYSGIGEVKKLKANNKNLLVGVGGCASQDEGESLLKKYKHIDFVFGTDEIDHINDMVYRLQNGEDRFSATKFDESSDYSIKTQINHGTPQAFVNIMKGCDNFCSYCIVPYTRGREKSRALDEIVDDVRNLVETKGIEEVTLLGQNVNSFGRERGEAVGGLLYKLDDINGLKLIRYTTSHPKDLSDELIIAHGEIDKLANSLHLAVQSGSDSVLKRMNRKYTKEHYLNLLTKLRRANPDIVISTDIIVGFPNETEEEFMETMDLLDRAQFDSIFSFKYSVRPGTKAALMEDSLTEEVKSRRLQLLQKHQLTIQEKIRSKLVGSEFKILVDGKREKKGVLKWGGRSSCNRIIHFEPKTPSDDYLWKWIDVKITSATALSLQGELV